MIKPKKGGIFSSIATQILNKEITQKVISGTYRQRWEILNALYSMFLEGCGYNGCNWRENSQED